MGPVAPHPRRVREPVHELAAAATDRGDFADQLAPVPAAPGLVADEGLRRGTTPETLAKLKPAFREDGVIHAGNASQISDGASAVLMATSERAAELGLTPIARYHSARSAGPTPSRCSPGRSRPPRGC